MAKTATGKSARLMAVFGLASLAAVGLGAAVCALNDVSAAWTDSAKTKADIIRQLRAERVFTRLS